jgi:nucleotide-binding universal stress UspA family protein
MISTVISDRAQPATPPLPLPAGPVLLAFDGSRDAAAAIASAGRLLAPRDAVVITAWEPAATWVPYDPVTVITAPVERIISHLAGVDESLEELAQRTVEHGVELALEAGFRHPEARVLRGKPFRVIGAVAEEVGADPIVVGARGAGRIESALLGSVSGALVLHAKRPVLVVPHHSVP